MAKGKKSKRLPGPPCPKPRPINPFNIHQNRKKFSVLGQKVKGTKGLPGVARQIAFDNRSKTLLVDYLNRNRANKFIDRRLGETNKDADQGTKDDLRRVEYLRRTSSKHTLYNLSDETEVLTHGGVPITEEMLKVRDFDEQLEEDGMLDAEFVKKQHFGGASLCEDRDVPLEERKYKSQKDKIDEIVAESKMRKLQAKQDQESQRKKVDLLDSQFKNFMEMMTGNFYTNADKKKAKREDSMRDYDRLMHSIAADGGPRANPSERLKTDQEIAKEKKEELERLEADRLSRMKGDHEDEGLRVFTRSADSLDKCIMKQFDERPMVAYKNGELLVLNAEGKTVTLDGAKPSKRLTKEERRKRRKQQKMEKKMRLEEKKLLDDYLPTDHEDDDSSDSFNEDDDSSDSFNEDGDGDDRFNEDDDGDDRFNEDDDGDDSDGNEHDVTTAEGNSTDDDCADIAGASEDEEEGSEENVIEEESDEEDKFSDILEDDEEGSDANETSQSDGEAAKPMNNKDVDAKGTNSRAFSNNGKDENISSRIDAKRKRVSFSIDTESNEKGKVGQQEDGRKELPYTLEVPDDYGQFWEALQGRTAQEAATLVDRMIATNHPHLQHSNLLKCSHLFAYLLQLTHGLCSTDAVSPHPPTSPLSYLDPLTPHLFNLARLVPLECAKAFLLVFIEKRDEYRNRVKKRYPTLDMLVFLQLAGVLYPASDFYHPVMTPVRLFLTQLLGEAKMKEPRDVLAALFCATLLLEYIRETKRYCSELLARLMGLALCCIPAHAQDAEVRREIERCKLQRSNGERVRENHVPLQWLVHSTLPPPDMLLLSTATKITCAPPKFQLSMLNDQNLVLSDQFRCTVLLTCLKLLHDLCQCWSDLPSVREALSPLHSLLPLLPTHLYPDEVLRAKEDLQRLLDNLPHHPARMRINRGRPKPLRMYEPLVMPIKAETSRKALNKSGHRALKQKLLHCVKKERKAATREIKKDNMFLAHQKLKETLASDAERQKKVRLLMSGLQLQEGEHKKFAKLKLGRK